MNAYFHLFKQALSFQIKQKELLIWLATQIVLAVYVLMLGVSEKTVDNYLGNNLSQLLGADIVVETQTRLPAEVEQQLNTGADKFSMSQVFGLNVFHQDNRQALSIKNVDQSYPVKGTVTLATQISGQTYETAKAPGPGELWLGQRALVALEANVGDILTVLGKPHKITAILVAEPDQLIASESVTPRALINMPEVGNQFVESSRGVRYLLMQDETSPLNVEKITKDWQVNIVDVNSGEHPLSDRKSVV